MFKKFAGISCLVLAGCFAALMIAEGFVRIFYPHSRDHVIPGGLFEMDGRLGWKLRPGTSAIHRSVNFEVVYDINAMGFRDRSRDLPKSDNVYRVLIFGDSHVFGWGVPQSQRFTDAIENQRRSFEIWNLAVPGYGLDQEILSYEQIGRTLNAEEVFFYISESTLERARYGYIFRKQKPKFAVDVDGKLEVILPPRKKQLFKEILYRTLSPMYLPYFLEQRIAMFQKLLQEGQGTREEAKNSQMSLIGEFEKKMLERAIETAAERHQRITLIAVLDKKSQADLVRFCNQRDTGCHAIVFDRYNSLPTFSAQDPHWTAQAHKLIAEKLLLFLDRKAEADF